MTIPLASMAKEIAKTMVKSKAAIKKRLRFNGWNVREGVPNMKALPRDDSNVSAWVFCSRTNSDADGGQASNWQSEAFMTQWQITLIADAKGNLDQGDTNLDPIIEAATRVLESLTEDADGYSLDGSVNWSDRYDIKYGIATVGGDRDVLTAVISLQAHHPIFPNRVPPGV